MFTIPYVFRNHCLPGHIFVLYKPDRDSRSIIHVLLFPLGECSPLEPIHFTLTARRMDGYVFINSTTVVRPVSIRRVVYPHTEGRGGGFIVIFSHSPAHHSRTYNYIYIYYNHRCSYCVPCFGSAVRAHASAPTVAIGADATRRRRRRNSSNGIHKSQLVCVDPVPRNTYDIVIYHSYAFSPDRVLSRVVLL